MFEQLLLHRRNAATTVESRVSTWAVCCNFSEGLVMHNSLGLLLLILLTTNPEDDSGAAIAALESKGARVTVHATMTSVTLSRRATDEDMRHVQAIPNVKSLRCSSRHISDDGMRAIAKLQLAYLTLYSLNAGFGRSPGLLLS